MSKAIFIYPVLNSLNNGGIIRKSIAVLLRILGLLSALVGIVAALAALKYSFQGDHIETTLGGLVFTIVVLLAFWCIVQIYFYRAGRIAELRDSEFTIIPVVSILFRLLGEITATGLVAIGVGGCALCWFAGMSPGNLLSDIGPMFSFFSPAGGGFLGGIVFVIQFIVLAFCCLMGFYFLAELTNVATDIARNTRSMASALVPEEGPRVRRETPV